MNKKLLTELESIINDLSEISNMGELEFQQNDKKGAVNRLKTLQTSLTEPGASTQIHGSGTGDD